MASNGFKNNPRHTDTPEINSESQRAMKPEADSLQVTHTGGENVYFRRNTLYFPVKWVDFLSVKWV